MTDPKQPEREAFDLDELEAKARAATPGPWHIDDDDRPGMEWNRHIASSPNMAVCFMAHSNGKDPARDEATAAHIAAFSPKTALAMIAELRRLQAIVGAPRGTDAQILKERELTCSAISGAMAFGSLDTQPPPEPAHWLAPYWNLAREAEKERQRLRNIEQLAKAVSYSSGFDAALPGKQAALLAALKAGGAP